MIADRVVTQIRLQQFVLVIYDLLRGDPRHIVGISYPVMFSDERDEPLGLCSEGALTRRCNLPLLGPLRDDRLERHDFRPLPRGLPRVEVKPLEQITQNRWRLAQQFITTERIEVREFRVASRQAARSKRSRAWSMMLLNSASTAGASLFASLKFAVRTDRVRYCPFPVTGMRSFGTGFRTRQ